ncbi:MAG: mechanosensitive ion channel [Deltaproteobacteria bacterium]|nr:mechanosensitive ion channel [Deltaproteobacteria bacterium]
MNTLLLPNLTALQELLYKSVQHLLIPEDIFPQFLSVLMILLVAMFLSKRSIHGQQLTRFITQRCARNLKHPDLIRKIFLPFFTMTGALFMALLFQKMNLQFFYLKVCSIAAALILTLRALKAFLDQDILYRILRTLLIVAAVLHISGILDDLILVVDNIGFQWRGRKISLFFLFKVICLLTFLFSLIPMGCRFVEHSLNRTRKINPSVKVILGKLSKVAIYTLAFFISLDVIGIDLTALTVFSGAVGIGIGFGLQKIFSNFISGIILLSDRSIKPGDVIGIDNTYGWVNALGARYVSIITRDGKEHLIPNESLITSKVENWSFSDSNVRVRIPVRIDYQTDIHRAIELIVNVAKDTPRVLKHPEARCLVRNLGEYAIELELRIWISDPASGMGGVQSEILMGILTAFRQHGIRIPYPVYKIRQDAQHDMDQAP